MREGAASRMEKKKAERRQRGGKFDSVLFYINGTFLELEAQDEMDRRTNGGLKIANRSNMAAVENRFFVKTCVLKICRDNIRTEKITNKWDATGLERIRFDFIYESSTDD